MGKIFGGGAKKPKRDVAGERRAAQAAQRQTDELAKLKSEEDQRTAAAGRKRRGRASLISGDETGISNTLG